MAVQHRALDSSFLQPHKDKGFICLETPTCTRILFTN